MENEARKKLLKWWDELQGLSENAKKENLRGERAMLRRAESPADVMLSSVFYKLCHLLPPEFSEYEKATALAITAGVLSHVQENNTHGSFAQQLGTPKKDGPQKPPLSELRFQNLAKSSTPDEFYRRLVRAVKILGKTANVVSLADNVYHWVREHKWGKDRKPENQLVVKWAGDYFNAVSKIK